MKLRDLGIVILYMSAHLLFAQLSEVLFLPIPRILDIAYKLLISFIFLRIQKVEMSYAVVIIALGLLTRSIFHGPYPWAIVAGWFYLYTRNND